MRKLGYSLIAVFAASGCTVSPSAQTACPSPIEAGGMPPAAVAAPVIPPRARLHPVPTRPVFAPMPLAPLPDEPAPWIEPLAPLAEPLPEELPPGPALDVRQPRSIAPDAEDKVAQASHVEPLRSTSRILVPNPLRPR